MMSATKRPAWRCRLAGRFAAGGQDGHVGNGILVPEKFEKFVSELMLTLEQKTKATRGFSRGLQDTHIAKLVDASHMSIYKYRKSLGITKDEVLDKRYDAWIKMLNEGMDIEDVAALYLVKKRAIEQALWSKRGFSFVDAKRKHKEAQKRESSWDISKLFS